MWSNAKQTLSKRRDLYFQAIIGHLNSNLTVVIGLKTSEKVKVELPIQSLLTSNTKLMRKIHFCLLLRELICGHNTLFGHLVSVTII
jgi:hypothetical protein